MYTSLLNSYLEGCSLRDVWGSLRDGPPCCWCSGNLGRWGHQPSLWSGGRTGASKNSRNRTRRGLYGKTGTAVVRLGQLEGEWRWAPCWTPETGRSLSSGLVGGIWLNDKRPLPARHQRWGRGVDVVTSYSQSSKNVVVWGLEGGHEGSG